MDVVVTVPKSIPFQDWIAEGDAPGTRWDGQLYYFRIGKRFPKDIQVGDRVYVVYNGILRGYAPLIKLEKDSYGYYYLVRGGGAVAVTIPQTIKGFQGFRYRWWSYEDEQEFPEWDE